MSDNNQVTHRSGPLKQSNKKHKSGLKRSSRSASKGRINVKVLSSVSHKAKKELNKKERRHKANLLRKNKRDNAVMKKRGLGYSGPPILVAILATEEISKKFLSDLMDCDDYNEFDYNENGHCHLNSCRLKQRFTFICPKFGDMHAVMDTAKVVDTLLFIQPEEPYDEYTEKLLSVILSHACPSTVHIVRGIDALNQKKKSDIKKKILKRMESRFPGEKLYHADTKADLRQLLRYIGLQKQQSVKFRNIRSYILAEKITYECLDPKSHLGMLKVSGFVRSQPFNPNKLIHIPGWDNFQVSKIIYHSDYDPISSVKKKSGNMDLGMADDLINDDILEADPLLKESLQSEVIPDALDAEQTWPTEEELNQAVGHKIHIKRVVEGTSEYQAGWIIEDNEDNNSEENDALSDGVEHDFDESYENSDAESMVTAVESFSDDDDMKSVSEFNGVEAGEKNSVDYDKDINMEEDIKMRVKFREERMEQLFPDEEDTPIDIPARIRYQKYRGLKDFSTASWDPMENLPLDYAKIYRFENFKLTKKHVLKAERSGAQPGSFVTVCIMNVPMSLYDGLDKDKPLVIYELLSHEQKFSIMNVIIKKHALCKVPIKSKDELIFHVGFRRFVCKPIFSAHHAGNKFKYERFLPNDAAAVATFFAPVTFPPVPVTVFRRTYDGDHDLVATGCLLDVNPNRIIVKRIVLSGHTFKISKKLAIVRYMFFNREDINWFKKIQLKTKYGIRGEIKEPLGSHGHMKCKFEKQIPSQDVILMALYKRIFPKWTYNPYVPYPLVVDKDTETKMLL